MTALRSALQRELGSEVRVRQLRYRARGWNAPSLDAVRDARAVLEAEAKQFDAAQIVVVGHSMGGRVAAHLAADGKVGAVVALAPWWPADDADAIPLRCRLLVVHGTADTWTSPVASREQVRRAGERGIDAQWVGLPGADHYLMRQWHSWHRLTADLVRTQLGVPSSD
jgi:pimeloyl-ACP methyl ester carboxylesterase